MLSAIDLSTILCELLTIALANVPYSASNTLVAYKVCSSIAIAVLVIMLLTLVAVMFQIGRFGGGSEVPKTLAGKLRLLVGGSLPEKFSGMGDMGEKARDKIVVGLKERYKLGNVRGWDGVVRLGIDSEEYVERSD